MGLQDLGPCAQVRTPLTAILTWLCCKPLWNLGSGLFPILGTDYRADMSPESHQLRWPFCLSSRGSALSLPSKGSPAHPSPEAVTQMDILRVICTNS